MSSYLLIDAGNSRIKWTVSVGGELASPQNAPYPKDISVAEMSELFVSTTPVDKVFMICVTNEGCEKILVDGLHNALSAPVDTISVQPQSFGITICYKDAERLGADRWAAMIAARHIVNGPVCIIDSGTATTVDLVAADGLHLGGLIVPGLELMTTSLLEGTARIFGEDSKPQQGILACDTLSAVASGSLQATVGLIERLMREVPQIAGKVPTFVLCGGNAKDLLPLLPSDIRHEPDLVLKGLNIIAMDRL